MTSRMLCRLATMKCSEHQLQINFVFLVYIHLGEGTDKIKLRITGSEKNENRKFSIKVSQIECTSNSKGKPNYIVVSVAVKMWILKILR